MKCMCIVELSVAALTFNDIADISLTLSDTDTQHVKAPKLRMKEQVLIDPA